MLSTGLMTCSFRPSVEREQAPSVRLGVVTVCELRRSIHRLNIMMINNVHLTKKSKSGMEGVNAHLHGLLTAGSLECHR